MIGKEAEGRWALRQWGWQGERLIYRGILSVPLAKICKDSWENGLATHDRLMGVAGKMGSPADYIKKHVEKWWISWEPLDFFISHGTIALPRWQTIRSRLRAMAQPLPSDGVVKEHVEPIWPFDPDSFELSVFVMWYSERRDQVIAKYEHTEKKEEGRHCFDVLMRTRYFPSHKVCCNA